MLQADRATVEEHHMPHQIDKVVGTQIRKQRILAKLTQQQLAKKVGVQFQQIQKYETATNRVSASRLWEIAKALDVPVSFFFPSTTKERQDEKESVAQEVLDEKEIQDLIRYYGALPEEIRDRFNKLVTSIAEPHS